ncbi:PTS lactose/cellobiose transporter subunit IIA [Brochothrix campestris]|uniref:Cellobiose-specific PTS system IIA component n=1 Tax=Brochothrix campestris FSL F6-1037 TaxID=1265861 RepID=W7CLX5_9LIST|nr:PTS lactose/cellobiose transporter subunit IIA [Brochothrix campestris]EUJ38017.1 cellobiose-specific PTS system IIA component [Brochothrix campestris FSL F6-1037]
MITEEMKEQFNEQSMLMILHAGDAREKVNEALDQAMTGAYNTAAELIKEAKENINKSHKIQTVQVQKEAKEEAYYYSMLFAHAQDTLMTVQSEYNITKKLIPLLERLEQKINEIA